MSAQAATSTIRFWFAFFSFFSHQFFHSLGKIFQYLNQSALFQLFFFVVLFYLSPFSCFHLKSDRFGRTLNCFPLEAESSPVCLSDVAHYTFWSLKREYILSSYSWPDAGSPYSFTSLPELSQRLRRPGPPLPPAGPAPCRAVPRRRRPGRGARQPRRHPALRRALPGRKGLQASDCRRANGLLPAAGRGPDALRMVPLPENTQKNHGGREVFPSLQNVLHSVLKWGEFLA